MDSLRGAWSWRGLGGPAWSLRHLSEAGILGWSSLLPPYPAWGAPEEAAWSEYSPARMLRYWLPPAPTPWIAWLIFLVSALSFLVFWAYSFRVYGRQRIMEEPKGSGGRRGKAADSDEDSETEDTSECCYVMLGMLEHSLPHLAKGKAIAGGLGKVMDLVARHHPTRITMVTPMLRQGSKLDYELDERAEERDSLRLMVDGVHEIVRVFRQVGAPAGGPSGPEVDFLLLSHPLFEARTREYIYPNPMTRRQVLRFYSLWNQAMGALIVRNRPDLVHTPDFHTAVAPWYAVQTCPWLRIVLVLHNAEYQGNMSTDMILGDKLCKLAEIWNLPTEFLQRHLIHEGRFNMLKAGVDFVMEKQDGKGIYAVSNTYAREVAATYSLLWSTEVEGLDNPMLEEERAVLEESLEVTKRKAKLEMQELLGLQQDPDARMFVSLGRMVRQKGVDIIADIADWLLSSFENAQLVVIGPVADGYGVYAKERLLALAERPEVQGRLFVRPEFMQVPSALKFATDFCLMPSRDEPFGYVDIEFAWHGAVMVGAEAGGLGKVPGFYYIAQNRENLDRLQIELKQAITLAMEASSKRLHKMSEEAVCSTFPLGQWKRKLVAAYGEVLDDVPEDAQSEQEELLADHSDPPSEDESGRLALRQQRTFAPFGPNVRAHGGKDKSLTKSVSTPVVLLDEMVAHQEIAHAQSYCRDCFREVADEFLVQELSEDELAERMREKVKQHPWMKIDAIVEKIGGDVDVEREPEGSMQRWLLTQALGVARVHILVICGYLIAPLVDFVVMVMATECALRSGARVDFDGKALKYDSFPALAAIFMSCNALALVPGALAWAELTRHMQPRIVMGVNLLLHFLFAVVALTVRGDFLYAVVLVFSHGLVSSASLLFLAFSFMMSIKADISVAAIRMGIIETVRYAIIWLPTIYVLLVQPTSFAGTKEQPVPAAVALVMLPAGIVAAACSLGAGVLFFFAPGPYRDDRFPGWELGHFGKRKSFLILGLADCLAALGAFPSLSYMTWWFSQDWKIDQVALLGGVISLVLALGFLAWALALSAASKHSLAFLGGAAVLLPLGALIRAALQAEMSAPTLESSASVATLLLCVATLLLEGIRASAQWTAKIKVLNSRWRLLSYGSIMISLISVCTLLSPLLPYYVGYYAFTLPIQIRVGTTDPEHIALLTLSILFPIGLSVQLIQAAAAPFILKDLGVPTKRVMGKRNKCTLMATHPGFLALFITVVTGGSIFFTLQYRAFVKPLQFSPANRCPGAWSLSDVDGLKQTCSVVRQSKGKEFERNSNAQITTARYNCLQSMRQSGGNTFALLIGPGSADNECSVMKCGKEVSHHEPDPDVFAPLDSDVEVWSQRCPEFRHNFVGVQLMEWNWTYIGEECERRLGPEGWTFVQVSPPAEHILGPAWYVKYQQVSFKLESRSGSEEQFRAMVKKCRAAGVSVMVDFVINHMAAPTPPEGLRRTVNDTADPECGVNYDCRGWNGSWYGSREYGANDSDPRLSVFRRNAFHHLIGNDRANCGIGSFASSSDAKNPFDSDILCDMSGCVDLNTEKPETQAMIQNYLLRLTDAGVTMIRVDAAVAVYPQSIAYILQPFPWEYVVQEILWAYGPDNFKPKDIRDRVAISSIMDNTYGQVLMPAMTDLSSFARLPRKVEETRGPSADFVPSDEKAMVWLDNQDWQRNTGWPTYKDGLMYRSFMHFMLAYPWARAVRIMSSYYFTDNAQGPPGVGDGLVGYPDPVECRHSPLAMPAAADASWSAAAQQWICEHRWPGVAPLVRLRRLLGKAHPVRSVAQNSSSGAFAFALGSAAFFALSHPNGAEDPWSLVGLQAGLPAGTYCNVAGLSGALPEPSLWVGSAQQQQCSDLVRVDAAGRISLGSCAKGCTVALHAQYQRNDTASALAGGAVPSAGAPPVGGVAPPSGVLR